MRFTDMADEMFGAAQGALPAGVRLATAKRGGVTITRVEIAREGLAKPRGRFYAGNACPRRRRRARAFEGCRDR